MASLYQRPKSPYWWISYRDAKTGRIVRRSTRFKIGIGTHMRQARRLCAEYTLAEMTNRATRAVEHWDQWVPDYLKARYSHPLSLRRMRIIWANLALFLEERDITSPRALTREQCLGYVAWRTRADKPRGKFPACHNTSVAEIKSLSMLMAEAVRRGYCVSNPCLDLGLRFAERKRKPELTDTDIDFIRACIAKEPEPLRAFLHNSFEIARYQGCRLSETWLNPMTDVDTPPAEPQLPARDTPWAKIRFRAKGGRTHEAPLHPKLVSLFADLRARGQTQTYPKTHTSIHWHHFFRRHGIAQRIPNICFHSLRVTSASRMARARVPESQAMRFLGHASTTIHRSYQRVRLEDLGDAMKALS